MFLTNGGFIAMNGCENKMNGWVNCKEKLRQYRK